MSQEQSLEALFSALTVAVQDEKRAKRALELSSNRKAVYLGALRKRGVAEEVLEVYLH